MTLPPYDPVHDPPYAEQYPADYRGKRVLDVGADYGSTTEYFLDQGAAHVYAVEANHDQIVKLKSNFAGDNRVSPIYKEIRVPEDWMHLLRVFQVDIVKSDCEHMENALLEVDFDILRKVPLWLIETHDGTDMLDTWFRGAGFTVTTILQGTAENMGVNVRIIRAELI